MKRQILILIALLMAFVANGQTAAVFYFSGLDKMENEDYYGAVADFSEAINLASKNDTFRILYYYNRGLAKGELEDFKGAVADYTLAIEIDHYPELYYYRGQAKYFLDDYIGAIADLNIYIEEFPEDPAGYYYRGRAKSGLEDYKGAIADLDRAIEISPPGYSLKGMYLARGSDKTILHDYRSAISDFNKAIEEDPKYALAFFNRGLARIGLGKTEKGCKDLSKAAELGHEEAYEMIREFCQ